MSHQQPEPSYFPPTKPPNPMRGLSEFAVADTPGTAGPDIAGADYLACRPYNTALNNHTPRTPTVPHGQGQGYARGYVHGFAHAQGSATPGGSAGYGKGVGGVPTALERGIRPQGQAQGGLDRGRDMGTAAGARAAAAMPTVVPTAQRRRRETGTADDGGRPRSADLKRGGEEERSDSQGPHGRRRGEVTLEANEAGLERKNQQQAAARKEIMDARRRGYDVDGRGQSGPSGRQPRAEHE